MSVNVNSLAFMTVFKFFQTFGTSPLEKYVYVVALEISRRRQYPKVERDVVDSMAFATHEMRMRLPVSGIVSC